MNEIQRNSAVRFGLAAARALNSDDPSLLGAWRGEFGLFHGQFGGVAVVHIGSALAVGGREPLPQMPADPVVRRLFRDMICTWAAAALAEERQSYGKLSKNAAKRRAQVEWFAKTAGFEGADLEDMLVYAQQAARSVGIFRRTGKCSDPVATECFLNHVGHCFLYVPRLFGTAMDDVLGEVNRKLGSRADYLPAWMMAAFDAFQKNCNCQWFHGVPPAGWVGPLP